MTFFINEELREVSLSLFVNRMPKLFLKTIRNSGTVENLFRTLKKVDFLKNEGTSLYKGFSKYFLSYED